MLKMMVIIDQVHKMVLIIDLDALELVADPDHAFGLLARLILMLHQVNNRALGAGSN